MSEFINLLGSIKIVFGYGISGVLSFLAIYWLFFPEKAQIASSQLYKILRKVFKSAEKKYITYDIEGRVNDYVNNFLSREIKDFSSINISLNWINDQETEDSFFQKDKLVIRMRMSDNQNQNFVNSTMIFIAQNILTKAKKYISDKQKESIDLFIAKKLFEEEKGEIMHQFVSDYLSIKTDDEKIGTFFEKYHFIDRAGLFFPVFIQEMSFLGEKVFAHRKDETIYKEVNGLVDFLDNYSLRRVGDNTIPTSFNGFYCKFGIMIVGLSSRVKNEGQEPYINHLKHLKSSGVETIYLIGDIKNKDFMNILIENLCVEGFDFSLYNNKEYTATITYQDERKKKKDNYLIVLRKNEIEHYFPSKI